MMTTTSPLDQCRSAEECAADLDAALDDLIHWNGCEWCPKVCFCCDRSLLSTREHSSVFTLRRLKKMESKFALQDHDVEMADGSVVPLPRDLIGHYQYSGPGAKDWLQPFVVSPSSCYCPKRKGFLVCKEC